MKTLRRVRSFTVDLGAPIDTITWSPAGDRLAFSGGKGRVQLWSVGAQPRLVRALQGLRAATKLGETVNAVEFSPNGDLVAAVAAVQGAAGPESAGRPRSGLEDGIRRAALEARAPARFCRCPHLLP
jgi:hypothetical protein